MYVVVLLPIAIQLSQTARVFPYILAGWYSSNDLALYSESLPFESRPRHRLTCLSSFTIFLSPSRKSGILSLLGHIRFFTFCFQIPHSPVLPFGNISSWYGVVNNPQRKSPSNSVPIVHHAEGRMDWRNISLTLSFHTLYAEYVWW